LEDLRISSFTFSRQLTIEWGHCDPAGIVFISRVFELFDVNTWLLFQAALGVKPHELAAAFGIMGIPLVDVRANFINPVKFGDNIVFRSRVKAFRRSSFDVDHQFSIDGQIAMEGSETRVWAARAKDDPIKIAGVTIPADVIARFG
jgi:4-hydroxybenzoyl-CoA thioesterase